MLGDENSVLGVGSSTSCKVQRVGEACAHDALAAAIHGTCVQVGVSPRQIARTCAGITGAGRPEIAKTMWNLLAKIVGGEIEIVGDVEIAFEDAFGRGPGVLVMAGTGSIVYGRSSAGETARAGGWGHAISDEGSGHWIGVEAVRAALRTRDRGENPDLLQMLMDAMGARDADDFIVRVNANPAPDFGALFPTVLSAASQNSLAAWVLDRAGSELANLSGAVIPRLFTTAHDIPVATHGGVLTSGERVRNSFCKHLESLYPAVVYRSKTLDPARAALELARRGFAAVGGR